MRHDLWFALRRIYLRPAHSAIVALTLGLGIGAALAVFAVVDAVLIRPLPYDNADRLVSISQTIPVPGMPEVSFSDVGYRRLVSDARSLTAVAAYDTREANLIGKGAPQRITTARVTASLFTVLGVRAALGRPFTAAEDVPNGPRVIVLSNAAWRALFDADPNVVGSVANIEGEPFTIVGVLGPSIVFPSRDVAAWEPLRLDPAAVNPYGRAYTVVGLLKPNVTFAQAVRDLVQPIRAVGREYPGPHAGSALDMSGFQAKVRWLGDQVVGDTRPLVLLLLGGVTMLLLLTCANVANLQLASALTRREELAVRSALGATRGRLIRGALLEGLVLSAMGAVIGLSVASLGGRLLATLLPAGLAPNLTLVGGRALAATAVIVLVIGASIGALPVAWTAHRESSGALRDRAGGSSGSGRVRRLLAAAQVALAVMLLHGSGLLLASAREVSDVPLGFRPDSVMTFRLNLPSEKVRDRAQRETLLRRILADVQAIPGVRHAAVANALPLMRGRQDMAMALEGRPFRADGTDPLADYRVVTSGYFDAMGIKVQRGRTFTDDDANERYTPLVISAGLAREIWGDDTDPVGHRLRFGPNAPWMPIIGVVADAKNRSLTQSPRPELYAPALGTYANLRLWNEITLIVRASTGNAGTLVTPIRRAIAGADPELPVYEVASMRDVVRNSRAQIDSATRLIAAYAIAALLLAVAGTYAVLSYLVSQRGRELAVRLALGAAPREVVRLVARESAVLIGVGVAMGLLSALALARLVSGLLYGVGALDGGVVLAVVSLTAVAGLVASLVPARRAARVDPCVALKGSG